MLSIFQSRKCCGTVVYRCALGIRLYGDTCFFLLAAALVMLNEWHNLGGEKKKAVFSLSLLIFFYFALYEYAVRTSEKERVKKKISLSLCTHAYVYACAFCFCLRLLAKGGEIREADNRHKGM